MQRFLWLTDLHLNFVERDDFEDFLRLLTSWEPDGVWFTGDLAESHDVVPFLEVLDDRLGVPFYFVLGNHDFYFSSIAKVRQKVDQLTEARPNLRYLSHAGPLVLNSKTAIVGHDGWADARAGDYERSYVMMNDYRLIEELSGCDKRERRTILEAMGDAAATHIRRVLAEALHNYPNVILLTHVPPLREACWYDGRHSDDEWAPHFTCQAVGDAILETMRTFPNRKLLVLCGHTHGAGETQPASNVLIWTGGAVYGKPAVCRVFEENSGDDFFGITARF